MKQAMHRKTNKSTAARVLEEPRERTLVHIPIVHTLADMGALGQTVYRLKIEKLGQEGWERNVNQVERLWTDIEQTIQRLALPRERVRLYQDGLPVCGSELEIVTELARAGSRNHQLLLRLREKGATIMGTESSDLLVEEYQLIKEVFASNKQRVSDRKDSPRNALRDSLLKRRDQFIACRINGTLLSGETGVLFLGVLHSVEAWLDKDIRVVRRIHQYFEAGE